MCSRLQHIHVAPYCEPVTMEINKCVKGPILSVKN